MKFENLEKKMSKWTRLFPVGWAKMVVWAICKLYTMAFPVGEFSREGYKIRKVFG